MSDSELVKSRARHDIRGALLLMQLQYELNKADLIASQSAFNWRRRRAFSWGFTIYGVLFFLFGVWNLIGGQVGLSVIPLVFGFFGTLFVPLILPRSIAKAQWKQAQKRGQTTLTTSAEGIEFSHSLARSMIRWQAFSTVIETPNAWLLEGLSSIYIIPKRAFASEEDKARFRAELSRINFPLSNSQSAPPIASP